MIPEYKKILYATDLSENARQAFVHAASLANRYHGKIAILHVVETLSQNTNMLLSSMMGEDRWKDVRNENQEKAVELIRGRLDRFCEEMSSELTACPFIVEEVRVQQGRPEEVIIDTIDKESFDIVVMGSHGHGGLAGTMMGSTARRVVRRSKIPALVIHI